MAATPYRGEIAANTMYTASIGRNQEKHGDSFAGRTAHAVVDSVRVYDTALTRQQLEDDPAERAVLALDFETEQQNGEFLDYGSSNFVVNGLVNADRTPQPELAQLAYSHAPVRFEGTGEPGEFRVAQPQPHADHRGLRPDLAARRRRTRHRLRRAGRGRRPGQQQLVELDLPPAGGTQRYLVLEARQRADAPGVPRGHLVATEQLPAGGTQPPPPPESGGEPQPLAVHEHGNAVEVSAPDFT